MLSLRKETFIWSAGYRRKIESDARTYQHISFIIPVTGKHEPDKLTCFQLSKVCGFIAQLVGHYNGLEEIRGSYPVKPPEFVMCLCETIA